MIGLARWLYFKRPGSGELFAIALAIEWMVRMEARSFEEGGFFDDGVFGYDFSQGYTSLDAGAATVRPPARAPWAGGVASGPTTAAAARRPRTTPRSRGWTASSKRSTAKDAPR